MPMIVKDLRTRALRWRMTPEQARESIQTAINQLEGLLKATTDAERCRIYNKFERRFTGYGNLENLVVWSALINPSPTILAGHRQFTRYSAREAKKTEAYHTAAARILHNHTGLPKSLCREIIVARSNRTPMLKHWPIKGDTRAEFVVTGPKGDMPLEGEGSPHWVYEDSRAT